MKIRTVLPALLLAALLAACMTAAAEPLVPDSDLTGTFTILYDEDDPSAGAFTFSYRYPHIDESLPDAYVVNSFYQSRIEEQETNVVFMADGFADAGIPVTMSCSYRITCSNDDFFSVLVQQEQTSGDFHDTVWQGNTFSRKNGTVDSACDLPRLLGILDAEEQDEYLVERQTGKAVDVVLDLVMDMIRDNPDGLPYYEDLTEKDLRDFTKMQEDFYLDENGDPVFYIAPGVAADYSEGYLTFAVPLEDILDEL